MTERQTIRPWDHYPLWMREAQVMEALGIGRYLLRELRRSGAVRAVRMGKQFRYDRTSLTFGSNK
jgi:hypothetical protein